MVKFLFSKWWCDFSPYPTIPFPTGNLWGLCSGKYWFFLNAFCCKSEGQDRWNSFKRINLNLGFTPYWFRRRNEWHLSTRCICPVLKDKLGKGPNYGQNQWMVVHRTRKKPQCLKDEDNLPFAIVAHLKRLLRTICFKTPWYSMSQQNPLLWSNRRFLWEFGKRVGCPCLVPLCSN